MAIITNLLKKKDNVNRGTINNNNNEIQNAWYWKIVVTNWAKGVYRPSNDFFDQRLVKVENLPTYEHDIIEIKDMPGGFKNIQAGGVKHDNASQVSFIFQDFVDSTIGYFFQDWMNKIEDPENKIGLPKSLLVWNIELYLCNSQMDAIRKYVFETGMPISVDLGDKADNKKESNGQIKVSFNFEWWNVKQLNNYN